MMAAATDVAIDSDRASQVIKWARRHEFNDILVCIQRGLFPVLRDNAFLFGRHYQIPEGKDWEEALSIALDVMRKEHLAANPYAKDFHHDNDR